VVTKMKTSFLLRHLADTVAALLSGGTSLTTPEGVYKLASVQLEARERAAELDEQEQEIANAYEDRMDKKSRWNKRRNLESRHWLLARE
jgi:hypothetical protein